MPESLAGARVKATLLCRRDKTRDGLLVRGSKEERLVKLTATGKLGVSGPEPCVFRDLPCTHVMKTGNADASFLGNLVECCADFFVRPSKRHTKVASRPFGVWDLEVEIAIRKKDPAAAFCDEGVGVPHLPAQRLYFIARA